MNKSKLNDISPDISNFIDEKKMFTIYEKYDAESFGNYVAKFRSTDFLFKVIRDRGELSLYIRPNKKIEVWHNVSDILEYIGESVPDKVGKLFLEFLSKNIDIISRIINSPSELMSLNIFERKKNKEFLKTIFKDR